MSGLYRQDWNINEPDLDSQGEQAVDSAPAPEAGGGSVSSGGTGGPSQALKAPSKSGIYTPLQKYVTANQGQAGAVGEKIAGNISQKTASARSALEGASQAFETQRKSRTPTIDQTIIDNFWNQAGQTDAQGNPLMTQQGKDAFFGQYNADYTGPKSYDDLAEANAATQQAGQARNYADLGSSEYGRQQLVGDLYGSRAKGPGMLALDAYLLRKSGLEPIKAAQSEAGQLGGVQEGFRAQAAQNAAQSAQQAADVKAQTRKAIQDRIAGFGTELGARAEGLRGTAVGKAQAARQRLEDIQKGTLVRMGDAIMRSAPTIQTGTSGGAGFGGAPVSGEAPLVVPPWAAELGLDAAGYARLANLLEDYSSYDTPKGEDPLVGMRRIRLENTPNAYAYFPVAGGESSAAPFYFAPALDLSQYAQFTDPELIAASYTPETVATDQERARLAALEQLLGQDIGYYSGTGGQPITSAGTFDLDTAASNINELAEKQDMSAYTVAKHLGYF